MASSSHHALCGGGRGPPSTTPTACREGGFPMYGPSYTNSQTPRHSSHGGGGGPSSSLAVNSQQQYHYPSYNNLPSSPSPMAASSPAGDLPLPPHLSSTANPNPLYFTHSCVLCNALLPTAVKLKDHLPSCPANTESCPHCRKGFQVKVLPNHVLTCQRHGRSCFVCNRTVPAANYLTHVNTCSGIAGINRAAVPSSTPSSSASSGNAPLRPVRMFHGTSHEVAQLIIASQNFHVSEKGLLGEGVYVTADIAKALRYGPAVIECAVYPGKTITIAKRFHPQQKCWQRSGYDSAWIPPNAFISTSKRADEAGVAEGGGERGGGDFSAVHAQLAGTRNATGGDLEENCVADPRRVVPLRLVRGGGTASAATAVITRR